MKPNVFVCALTLLMVSSSVVAANFPDAHEKPPAGWTGPVFKLSQNYPATKPAAETMPWKALDFQTQPEAYIMAVYHYALEGNLATDWRGYDNPTRTWYHAPWMQYGPNGREFIRGMTRERNSRPKELAPTQPCYWQNWAVGFYNPPGGYVIGQVWKDPKHPDASKSRFPDGTVSIKLLFTAAPESQVPYLKNDFKWQGNLDPLTGKCTSTDPAGVRTPADVRLLQIDIAVRDSRADADTGWIMGTFVYDGNSSGATPWERMIPVGVMWGNDPTLTPAAHAGGQRVKESWINPNLKIPQHLGWNGRLNGPVDNPLSACLSCHGTGQAPVVSPMLPPSGSTDDQKMRWFRNVKSGEAFDAGDSKKPISTDYSLQISDGIQNFQASGGEIKVAVMNGDVIEMMNGARVFPVSRDEGPEVAAPPAAVPAATKAAAAPAKPEEEKHESELPEYAVAGVVGFAVGIALMLALRRRRPA
jgi:hypothetical protein